MLYLHFSCSTKRGIDFGLGRGYSGNQAAKHFMGLVASQYAGGPGKRKRSGQQVRKCTKIVTIEDILPKSNSRQKVVSL